jgi:hypothetical protein
MRVLPHFGIQKRLDFPVMSHTRDGFSSLGIIRFNLAC